MFSIGSIVRKKQFVFRKFRPCGHSSISQLVIFTKRFLSGGSKFLKNFSSKSRILNGKVKEDVHRRVSGVLISNE